MTPVSAIPHADMLVYYFYLQNVCIRFKLIVYINFLIESNCPHKCHIELNLFIILSS